MKAARTAGVLVCLLGLALTSATTQVEPSATGHSDADSERQILEGLSRPGPDRAGLSLALQSLPETKGGNPGSAGLPVLLLVVYGSVISFLVARLLTYENYEKARSLFTPQNLPLLMPFVLCPIVIYVVMEFWRVANTSDGLMTTGWFLYDILSLLVALLALQGFDAGIRQVPADLTPEVFQKIIPNFCKRIAFGCVFLAGLLLLAVGRFYMTFGYDKASRVIQFDSMGAALSLVAFISLTVRPTKDFLFGVSIMTLLGFALAVGYLIGEL